MIGIKDMEMPKNCSEYRVRHECKVSDEWDEFDWYYDGRLDGCPLVEVEERKVGKWIIKNADNPNGGYMECPFCGALAPCTEFADETVWKFSKFCHDCGAEMRGGGDE